MNGKFFEVLLAAAIALSATDWGFKGLQDIGPTNTHYSPDELLNGHAEGTGNFGTNAGDHNNSFLTLKEEQNILNTIINLEESQRPSEVVAVNQNYFAYPLFSENSGETSHGDNQGIDRSSQLQELPFNSQDGGSPNAVRPSSPWPPSPSSPIDDGELFGAVGYAPLSDNQYFDIESFLNADFPSDFATESAISSLFDSPTVTRQTSITSQQSETIDQLAQFLGAAIDSPSTPDFSPKQGPKFPAEFTSVKNTEVRGGILEVGGTASSYVKGTSTFDSSSRISEMEQLLRDSGSTAAKVKRKGEISYGFILLSQKQTARLLWKVWQLHT